MDDQGEAETPVGAAEPAALPGAAGADDGTGAVLYGMFRSFTEVLEGLEERLVAIESAVRAGPAVDRGRVQADRLAADRLAAVERSVQDLSDLLRARAADPGSTPLGSPDAAATDEVVALTAVVRAQSEQLDRRTAELAAAVEALRALVQAHVDETAHSLGRRAGEAGRRLATDLGLRGRQKVPPPGL